jgi:outer membrane protein assembly factor BamB
MRNIVFILLVLSFILSCCKNDDDMKDKNGIVTSKDPLWVTSMTDEKDTLANPIFLRSAIIYKQNVVVRARKSKSHILTMLNCNNGKVEWEWNDWILPPGFGFGSIPYIKDNKLSWHDYENYQINLENGKTIWKNANKEHFSGWNQGLGDMCTVGHLDNINAAPEVGGGFVTLLSNLNGKPYYKFKPKYGEEKLPFDQSGWFYQAFGAPFFKNGDTLILVKFQDPSEVRHQFKEYLGLFNLSKKEWIYEKSSLKSMATGTWIAHPSVIVNDKTYHAGGDFFACHNVMTGEKLWETRTNSGYGFVASGIVVHNNKLYGNSDSGQLLCLDANTGQILWNIRTSGSTNGITIHNGIIYFSGGADGKLYAIDAETGQYYWKLESPDRDKQKWAIFKGACAVVPGEGGKKAKIVASTGLNVYCYEAIR